MQTRTQSTVVAIFKDSAAAQAALNDLKASGFSSNDVSISNDPASSTGAADRTGETSVHHEGGITGWFKSIFGQEEHDDRSYFEEAAKRGNVILSATVSDENVDRVADVLERHSPVDVHREAGSDSNAYDAASERGASTRTNRTATDTAAERAGASRMTNRGTADAAQNMTNRDAAGRTGAERAIPVVREDLQIGKRAVLRGGVRVYSRIVDEPVEEKVRLREEHVRVDRTPVNREANAADLRPGQEQTFEVKEYTEEPVVAKTSRVVEEIRVGKDTSERTETVRDNVRHTEVKIDNLRADERAGATTTGATTSRAAMAGTSSFDDDYRRDFEQNYASSGGRYEDYAPAYQYGNTTASDPRYKGRSWEDVEPTLRDEYGRNYPTSTWDRMKNSVRYGWDRMKAKA